MITPNIQLPITVICFLAIIFFQFFNAEKISLLSTRVFSVMLVFSCINLLFDCITVLTVEHYEVVPWLVRLSHQIYLGALNTILFIFYLYIEVIGDRGARLYRKKSYFVLIFYIGSMIALIGAPLYFVEETYFSYSYGMMKNIIYLVASIYMLFIISTVIYYRKSIMRSRRSAIYIGCVIWFAVAVVQYMLPRLQITALFISLMIFFLYLTLENPAQYVDLELNCFNKHSFQLMLEESFRGTNDFYVVTKVFEDASFVYGKGLLEGESGILYQTVQELKLALTANVYRSKGNAFSVIIDSSKMSIDECRQRLDLKQNGITKLHINILQCPKYANSVDEVFDMVKLASEQKVAAESSQIPVIILDESFLDMRSRKKIIESLLREAMETDGFEVFYQPIFSIDHAGFVSSEALVRLKDTSSIGYISPEEFIPIAEKNGLIMELGNLVFEKVCAFAKEAKLEQYGVHYIEINLSGIQGVSPKLPQKLKEIMEKYKIPPAFINLEITETATVESGEMLDRNMRQLRSYGCSFSMDDFGTGYSNLSQMAEISYDLVKIDKTLIWPCFDGNNEKSCVILSSVIHMIRTLGIKIVAEGVETKEQVETLTKMGVHYLQGYYFSKPIPETSYLDFLKKCQKGA